MGKSQKKERISRTEAALQSGIEMLRRKPPFGLMYYNYRIVCWDKNRIGKNTPAVATSSGEIRLNKDYDLDPKQWVYVIAHCMLHMVFGHFDEENMPGFIADKDGSVVRKPHFDAKTWNHACDIFIASFLNGLKYGEPLANREVKEYVPSVTDEKKIYEYLIENPKLNEISMFGTGAEDGLDMIGLDKPLKYEKGRANSYPKFFAEALADSVSDAIDDVSSTCSRRRRRVSSEVQKAAMWFQDHYPLLGGLASCFKIIEDGSLCRSMDISMAAISVEDMEIYINPANSLSSGEWRFILAHEYLHAGLEHDKRSAGRDSYLWNIACDYVVNGWLVEMNIGDMPDEGLLYDEELKGLSAESVYDILLENIKKYMDVRTFAGKGRGDIVTGRRNGKGGVYDPETGSFYNPAHGVSLDDFCRQALEQGLEWQQKSGRGFIPAGLIEEIRALSVPPIPWDVELARWFEEHFAPIQTHRSYTRPSRRQGATPDIPRPRVVPMEVMEKDRTFGVVVDTSGSMSPFQIGTALGAIASYSQAHEVPFARVIFCDAAAYDAGYISPEDIAGRVRVKGRGGTVLQPGVDKLEKAADFPADGPILIITDGEIESHLSVHREHAYLIPYGSRLPFRPRGKVFRFRNLKPDKVGR